MRKNNKKQGAVAEWLGGSLQNYIVWFESKWHLCLLLIISSCNVVEEYSYNGTETLRGSIEHEYHCHEHLKSDSINHCFYYHDTVSEDWELIIENIVIKKRLIWNKKIKQNDKK
tara:strand:+ start:1145 stop:1486 length:342 start_codon:yes stop_codon:yes gene_type:complete